MQKIFPGGFILTKPLCVCRPGQRTADDLEIIYDELLHIKALSHLSNTVSLLLHFWFVFVASNNGFSPEQPDTVFLILVGKVLKFTSVHKGFVLCYVV